MRKEIKERDWKTVRDNRILKILGGCLVGLLVGYFMLEHIATWEDPILGNTFHIVMGCVLIASSLLVIFVTLKQRYFPKKKRRGSKPVFLDDVQKKERKSKDVNI